MCATDDDCGAAGGGETENRCPTILLDSITVLALPGADDAPGMEKKQMANLPSINGRESWKWREIYLAPGCANRSNCIILGNEAKRFLERQKYEQIDTALSLVCLFGTIASSHQPPLFLLHIRSTLLSSTTHDASDVWINPSGSFSRFLTCLALVLANRFSHDRERNLVSFVVAISFVTQQWLESLLSYQVFVGFLSDIYAGSGRHYTLSRGWSVTK